MKSKQNSAPLFVADYYCLERKIDISNGLKRIMRCSATITHKSKQIRQSFIHIHFETTDDRFSLNRAEKCILYIKWVIRTNLKAVRSWKQAMGNVLSSCNMYASIKYALTSQGLAIIAIEGCIRAPNYIETVKNDAFNWFSDLMTPFCFF